jgi:hypothetical protein
MEVPVARVPPGWQRYWGGDRGTDSLGGPQAHRRFAFLPVGFPLWCFLGLGLALVLVQV